VKQSAHIVHAVQLSGIFVYPIKACGGVALARSNLVERGLAFDRRYMLVDRSGTFVSQREVPKLCRVSTAFEQDDIVASAPGNRELYLPKQLESGQRVPFRVWDSHGSGILHAEGSRWFSELLGDEVRLVFMPEDERRDVSPKRARPGDIVSFADAYPLLLISEASLEDLNARLAAPIEMRRFRPNLVISGVEPYAEDRMTALAIGSVSLRGVKRCNRCSVTTVDPETGERGKEPLRTLAQYRLEDGKVWFGMNLIHDHPGTLRVGDPVTLPATDIRP
jgi:uncharacterized protein YcbX